MDFSLLFLILMGLSFDFTNGFHDAANVVSTVIATRTLSARKAVLLAGLFNIVGALLSSTVAYTIANDLINIHLASNFVVGSALIGAIGWNLITWYFGLPSSSSAALIGGLIGVSCFEMGFASVQWISVIKKVILPMLLSPVFGFIIAYALTAFYYHFKEKKQQSEKNLKALQVISSLSVSLSHGMNDAQKSMGIITLGLYLSKFISSPHVPTWVIVLCAVTMGAGTAIGGFRIIRTVGYKITKLSVAQGCASEFSTATVLLAGSYFGMPISSTHVIVGAITGSGSAKHLYAVHWQIWQRFCLAWFVTAPAAAIIAIIALSIMSLM